MWSAYVNKFMFATSAILEILAWFTSALVLDIVIKPGHCCGAGYSNNPIVWWLLQNTLYEI